MTFKPTYDKLPIPPRGYRDPDSTLGRLRAELEKSSVGDSFDCDVSGTMVYKAAASLGMSVTRRKSNDGTGWIV